MFILRIYVFCSRRGINISIDGTSYKVLEEDITPMCDIDIGMFSMKMSNLTSLEHLA